MSSLWTSKQSKKIIFKEILEDKTIIPRISGTWCMQFDLWAVEHLGCDVGDDQGCDDCRYMIRKIMTDPRDGNIELGDNIVQMN